MLGARVPTPLAPPRAIPAEFGSGATARGVWLRAARLGLGCPVVAVSSTDGGVGRSTLVAALGGLLALACPPTVIAVDMTGRAWGGLGHRVGRAHPGTVWDAVRDHESLTDRPSVQRWTQCGPSGLLALVGEPEMTRTRRPPVGAETAVVIDALRTLYPIAVLDLPPIEVSETWTLLGAARAPVLVARATADSLRHTMGLLDQLRATGRGPVAEAAVVAVMAQCPSTPPEVRAVQRQTRVAAADLVAVPYDRGLARAAPLDPRHLRARTRKALLALAAAVLARCPTDPETAPGLTVSAPPRTAPGKDQPDAAAPAPTRTRPWTPAPGQGVEEP
jgi:MinD-like ATPase involved in chromosome partitioning or flagellar assembly